VAQPHVVSCSLIGLESGDVGLKPNRQKIMANAVRGRTKNTPNSSGQSRPLAPAPAASQHFGEIEARSADLSKVDKTRAEWGSR
jgi:hypothetical protein